MKYNSYTRIFTSQTKLDRILRPWRYLVLAAEAKANISDAAVVHKGIQACWPEGHEPNPHAPLS
ncbi:MAG: hypothetical protein DMG09_13255 [Acidobacteria bacterium]|nr:MAG: hypothetical protein DMG09_13255 [Acidobacteriota bacterium]